MPFLSDTYMISSLPEKTGVSQLPDSADVIKLFIPLFTSYRQSMDTPSRSSVKTSLLPSGDHETELF
ncbi:MAG: hypothetical protein BWY84_01047 [Candidatus Aerophobetes bacterium ADurb.Bin490]|nr:MAG: hypothetical protein BWY84_01047 [Candidatus Aerophobetes bacterium ADurb.Bin490]